MKAVSAHIYAISWVRQIEYERNGNKIQRSKILSKGNMNLWYENNVHLFISMLPFWCSVYPITEGLSRREDLNMKVCLNSAPYLKSNLRKNFKYE